MSTKDRILRILTEKKDKYVSGEHLSEELKISRTAVWKHVSKLKEEGYRIAAVSRRGYCLQGSEDIFDRSSVASRLNTHLLGNHLFFFHEIDSTNNEVKRMAASGAAEGTVVIAEKQRAGRGRRGRTWNSEAGKGIYMSVLLRPDIAPENIQAITLAASSAVCKVIEPYTRIRPGIKWPNDILLQDKKVCGILTEMSAEPDKIHSVILGIGINVCHSENDFPEDLRETATSLNLHSDKAVSRSELAAEVLKELENLYLDFIEKRRTNKFLNIWRTFSITLGCDIIVTQGEKTWKARALDVLDDGRLLVETDVGQRQALSSGEISVRKL